MIGILEHKITAPNKVYKKIGQDCEKHKVSCE